MVDNTNLQFNEENFFNIRNEIIDIRDDVEDMHVDVLSSAERDAILLCLDNVLALLEEMRKELNLPDKQYVCDG